MSVAAASVTDLAKIASMRARCWDSGYRPLQVYSYDHPDREKAGKAPLGDRWTERARQDPPEAVQLPAVAWAANTGILADQLRAIDVDIDDPELAGTVRALAIDTLGDTLIRCRANSGRCLLPYRAAEGSPRKRVLAGRLGKIEVLGHGQQFVSHGIHPSGAPLYWHPDPPELTPLDTLQAVTEEQISEFFRAVSPLIEADEPKAEHHKANGQDYDGPHFDGASNHNILDVIAALAVIPNGDPADWEHWNRVGMAAWAASGGSVHGFNGWCAWSSKHPQHDVAACRERWKHYPTSPLTGGGKLFRMAADAWPGWKRPSEGYTKGESGTIKCDRITPVGATEIPPRPWAYGNYLLRGTAAVLGAVDGAGKGAIAVVMALAMITGKPLLGERVWRKGPVAIVTYEDDIDEWHRRITAACLHYELDYEAVLVDIHFLHKPSGRVSFASIEDGKVTFPDSAQIICHLKNIGAVLLIIDPFNHAHALEDGNNNVMVAKVAGEVSRIAHEASAAGLVLHHLRKGSSGMPDDLMGATSLRATFRSARILQRMTPDIAGQMKITDPWRYIRIAGSKENYAPPPAKATWYKLIGVPLGNCDVDPVYPDGDDVGVATTWQPRPMFEGMDTATLRAVFQELRQTVHSPSKQSKNTPWAGNALVDIGKRSEREAAKIVAAWLESGTLTKGEYLHVESKHIVQRVVLDDAKAAEILASLEAASRPPGTE